MPRAVARISGLYAFTIICWARSRLLDPSWSGQQLQDYIDAASRKAKTAKERATVRTETETKTETQPAKTKSKEEEVAEYVDGDRERVDQHRKREG